MGPRELYTNRKKSREGKRYGRNEILPEIPSIFGPYKTQQNRNPEIESAAEDKRQRRLERNIRAQLN